MKPILAPRDPYKMSRISAGHSEQPVNLLFAKSGFARMSGLTAENSAMSKMKGRAIDPKSGHRKPH
jgi:hypothetical protein